MKSDRDYLLKQEQDREYKFRENYYKDDPEKAFEGRGLGDDEILHLKLKRLF